MNDGDNVGKFLSDARKQLDQEEAVLWNLVRLFSHTKRQREAIAGVERLVEISETPEKKARCYLAMGQLMEQMQNYEMAIKYYSRALALEPINIDTWYFIHNNLGYCLNHFGRYAEAETYCRRAIEIDPLRYNAYKNLGIAYEGQNDYAGAAICYFRAVQADTSDARAVRHLERLAERHPIVTVDVHDFEARLKGCQLAVERAAVSRGGRN